MTIWLETRTHRLIDDTRERHIASCKEHAKKTAKKVEDVLMRCAEEGISGNIFIDVCFEKGGIIWSTKNIKGKL